MATPPDTTPDRSSVDAFQNPPPRFIPPPKRKVDVWRAFLDDDGRPDLKTLESVLDTSERARAGRFFFETDRNRYVATHAAKRNILSRYVGIPPDRLLFGMDPHGKPQLLGIRGDGRIRFSLSRSHGIALFAVCQGREVGVDLERVAPDYGEWQFPERHLTAREIRSVLAYPSGRRWEEYTKAWVRKEAYAKATGEGTSAPFGKIDISVDRDGSGQVLDTRKSGRWSLREAHPYPGFSAAIVAEGDAFELNCWKLE
jgi:4'-phosphopantetheinyl transferase